MLGFAMKSVTQMVMGSTFEDEQEVIRFQKNHGTVSLEPNSKLLFRSCHRGSVKMNLTSIQEDAGLIPGLAQLVKDPALP